MSYDTNNTTAWTKNWIVTFPKLQPQYDFNQLKLLIIKITGYSCFQAVVIYVGKYFLHSCVMRVREIIYYAEILFSQWILKLKRTFGLPVPAAIKSHFTKYCRIK